MSEEWPPQDWLDALVARGGEAPASALSATVQFIVTGAPGGEARYVLRFEDGRVVNAERGSLDADVTFTQTYPDAQQMQDGDFDASAAFMQGRMKFAGDMAKLMSPEAPLLPAITAIAARAAA